MKRVRILYVILAVMVLASVGPLLFYAFKMMDINRRALETNENILQSTITRSIAEEISLHNQTFIQLLDSLDRALEVDLESPGGGSAYQSPKLRAVLERFVGSAGHVIYATLLDAQGKGLQAGNYSADTDPFLGKVLTRAFAASQQRRE